LSRSKRLVRSLLMPVSLWVLLVRTIVPKIRIPQWQFGRFSSPRSSVSQSNIQKQKTGAYSRKCQTVTATPAKPGVLPFGIELDPSSPVQFSLLITREALAPSERKLAPGGILTFHFSNLYLDLAPPCLALAHDAGLVCFTDDDIAVPQAQLD
jgi:hypothetical protein